MIEGLKIDVPFTELREHLIERATHHTERRKFYLDRSKDLTVGMTDLELDESEINAFSNSGRGDPREQLRTSAKSHEDRATFFQFMADHLITDEVYRITEADFIKLEFVRRYF